MRKLLWGAAAIAALGAQSAHAETTGHIDLSYEHTGEYYSSSRETNTYDLGGAVQTDFAAGWTVQLDGQTELQQWDQASGDSSHGYAAVHADTSMGNWQVGGFVGLMNWYGDGGKIVGAEARTSFGNLSVQGSAAYTAFNYNSDYSVWGLNVEGSYFLSPGLAITAGAGQSWVGYGNTSNSDATITEFNVGARYQLNDKYEVFGSYTTNNVDWDFYSPENTDSIRVGMRFHFNGGTLQDETNSGASWNGARDLQEAFRRSDW